MKTLKNLLIATMFFSLTMGTTTMANNVTKYEVSTTTDLKSTLGRMIKSDFYESNNYFQKENLGAMKEKVSIEFYIDKNQTLKVLTVDSANKKASDYVYQLLNDLKIKVTENLLHKKFKLELLIDYRI